MNDRTVVLLGELAASDSLVAELVRCAGAVPVGLVDWTTDREVFRRPGVLAVIFPASLRRFEELCLELRADLESVDLPLITVVPKPWDPQLDRLFMFGIDDFGSAGELERLEPKLTALAQGNPWADLKGGAGRVIIADPEVSRRILYGRLLRRKGFEIDFAADRDEVLAMATRSSDVRLILASAELPPGGVAEAIQVVQSGAGPSGALPWIVEGTQEQLETLNVEMSSTPPLRLFDRDDPPESVLFWVNEILSPIPANVRKSPRLLFSAPASFQIPGEDQVVQAFTYNINRTGLFLRTLTPPPRGTELIIEFRPPYGEGRVRVGAQVVWRKEWFQQDGPVVPVGMGVIFTKVPLADGAALEAGYEALLEAAPGQRTTNLPGPLPGDRGDAGEA